MDTLLDLLSNDAAMELLVALFGTIITLIARKVGRGVIAEQNMKKAREIVVASVNTLGDVAKEYKKQNADSKLTQEQKDVLVTRAISRAQEIGKRTGFDVVGTLGPELVQLAVTEAVKRLKARAIKNEAADLPADVKDILP
jgi:hypothetical protein